MRSSVQRKYAAKAAHGARGGQKKAFPARLHLPIQRDVPQKRRIGGAGAGEEGSPMLEDQ